MGVCCSTVATVTPEPKQKQPPPPKESSKPNSAGSRSTNACATKANSNTPSPHPRPTSHSKCTQGLYPRTDDVKRFAVSADNVKWDVEYPDYEPVEFFAIQEVPIEEDEDFRNVKKDVQWNADDGHVNRTSHQSPPYEIVDGVARNPVGRTGISGRGRLARWGPNHAADPILTRWKEDDNGKVMKDESSGKPVLQFIAIVRGDSGDWAIPGGFVDSGEEVYNALKREFCEEAMNSEQWTDDEKDELEKKLNVLFTEGTEVYRGYVDDPRNTDHAWMETVAVNFHDETGENVGKLQLYAGDDAVGVQWKDISSCLDLYASHTSFIQLVAELRGAHW